MMPRLGEKYPIDFEITSKPKAEYRTDEYFELDLPVAPAIMVGDEIVIEGSDFPEHDLEAAIRRHLGLDPLALEPNGFFRKLFSR